MSDLSEGLGKTTDELNKTILDIEQVFRDLKLGVPGRVPLSEDDTFLSFMKWGSKWQLVVLRERGDDDVIEPLTNANRKLRLEALDKLPELKVELEREAEDTLYSMKDKIAKTKKDWGLE
jgi:hypothetical protein